MKKPILQTSNINKQREYQRFGLDVDIAKGPDRDEVLGTPLEVILYKSLDAGPNTIVEDTSLHIDGHPDAGVNIRWLLEEGVLSTVNAHAQWDVYIAHNDGVHIFISHARLEGVLEPSEDEGFGFDPYFVPIGSFHSLHEMTDAQKDDVSPRRAAIRALLSQQYIKSYVIQDIPVWEGPMQC